MQGLPRPGACWGPQMSDPAALESLLSQMPRIAEAVNRFASEAVQRDAFDALMVAAGWGGAATARTQGRAVEAGYAQERSSTTRRNRHERAGASGKRPVEVKFLKDFDPAPPGKQPLHDFFAEKKPSSSAE